MRWLPILVLSIAPLAAAPIVRAQAPQAASPSSLLGEIRATGSQHYTSAQVAAASGLKPGDRVTKEELQQVADSLAQVGVFSKVNFRYTLQNEKVMLEFQVEDAPTVPLSFDNFPWFTDEELSTAIHAAEPLFDGASSTSGIMLDEITAVISKMLAAHKIAGTVEHQLIGQPVGDGMIMQFRVEGPELTVTSLDYGDALAQSSEKLKSLNTLLVGKPFSRFAVDIFENEQVRPLYLSAGHVRVHFGNPQFHFTGNPNDPLPSQVQVTLPVDPGPVFHIAAVTWTGEAVLPESALATLFVLQPGELADGMRIEAGFQRVTDEYGHRGYLDVQIAVQARYDNAASTASYNVALTEGQQYRMGNMIVTGLSPDSERALHLYWRLPQGAIFDRSYADTVMSKLEKPTGEIFGNIPLHYTNFGHFLQPNTTAHTVDVLLDFK